MSDACLRSSRVTRRFERPVALRDFDLEVAPGSANDDRTSLLGRELTRSRICP